MFFAGGDCAEDLSEHLRGSLSYSPALNVCSPDTLLRGIKELSCDSEPLVHPTSGVAQTFNVNKPLNELLAGALRHTGQLSSGTSYDLDYDNQVIATEKWDVALHLVCMLQSQADEFSVPITKSACFYRSSPASSSASTSLRYAVALKYPGLKALFSDDTSPFFAKK